MEAYVAISQWDSLCYPSPEWLIISGVSNDLVSSEVNITHNLFVSFTMVSTQATRLVCEVWKHNFIMQTRQYYSATTQIKLLVLAQIGFCLCFMQHYCGSSNPIISFMSAAPLLQAGAPLQTLRHQHSNLLPIDPSLVSVCVVLCNDTFWSVYTRGHCWLADGMETFFTTELHNFTLSI